jgi:ammonia channel protein AmtB
MSCISFTWWFIGYSLAFSSTSGKFYGNLQNFCCTRQPKHAWLAANTRDSHGRPRKAGSRRQQQDP